MDFKVLCLGLLCVFFASYIYTPIPSNIEEQWKVRILDAAAKISTFVAMCFENIGIMRFDEFISMILKLDYTEPFSDENITVTDMTFANIPRATDFLNRWTANKLDAVVLGVDYRLAPQHLFPTQFEDCITLVKFFLQDEILAKYGVDPTRICVSGDSSGGMLAAAVTQEVQNNLEIKHKIKLQALLYPNLQIIDSCLPSYQENKHGLVLTRDIGIKLVSLYLTKDESLPEAMRRNQYMPMESRPLFKFVNWSTLLPKKYRKDYVYVEPILGRYNYSLPALTDIRMSPLLASDSLLQNLPSTYILTCQYDIVRDDGIIYVSRLRNVGIKVTHEHIEDGIHAALSFMTSPLYLKLGLRIRDLYISWLDKNV
ncbi:arylacetamide deacetylase-like 2 isoform X2 [Erinaceus europaeus]|uniref:Arylacetamide deacetylase-like 2 isoform X2 n=1 Tax=Erinaceus europaeus TaxID=9365 RepID=A0ABM3XXR1_ERIEU|nr:arylacetamide deacetylase-like 2 isoform X2 [Erinaceus europaeus]